MVQGSVKASSLNYADFNLDAYVYLLSFRIWQYKQEYSSAE